MKSGVPVSVETGVLERKDSSNSVISILSLSIELCRICQCDASSGGEMISPCFCSGSLRWVHQYCLQQWIRASNTKSCELCRYQFITRTKMRRLCDFEALPLSPAEKRRFLCSGIFHLVALACVIWSLFVLIERTVEELNSSELAWQFWTKIIVEAIGCLGAGILVYIWGRTYTSLFRKWIAFNKQVIIISHRKGSLDNGYLTSTDGGGSSSRGQDLKGAGESKSLLSGSGPQQQAVVNAGAFNLNNPAMV